jgi:hypothetical protein
MVPPLLGERSRSGAEIRRVSSSMTTNKSGASARSSKGDKENEPPLDILVVHHHQDKTVSTCFVYFLTEA